MQQAPARPSADSRVPGHDSRTAWGLTPEALAKQVPGEGLSGLCVGVVPSAPPMRCPTGVGAIEDRAGKARTPARGTRDTIHDTNAITERVAGQPHGISGPRARWDGQRHMGIGWTHRS